MNICTNESLFSHEMFLLLFIIPLGCSLASEVQNETERETADGIADGDEKETGPDKKPRFGDRSD